MESTVIKKEINEHFNSLVDIISSFISSYKSKNSWKIRVIDSFIVFNFMLFIIQIAYMLLVGTYPKNSFLSGVICNIGTIAITSSLRLSFLNDSKSKQRIFLEYLICSFIFYLVIVNFLG